MRSSGNVNLSHNFMPEVRADTLVGTFTVSVQDNRILLPSHGLINGDQIHFAIGVTGNVLPAPFTENTLYFVVETRGNDFRVASQPDGTAIEIIDKGTGTGQEVWKIAGQPTWQMSSTVTAELPPKDFWEVKLIV